MLYANNKYAVLALVRKQTIYIYDVLFNNEIVVQAQEKIVIRTMAMFRVHERLIKRLYHQHIRHMHQASGQKSEELLCPLEWELGLETFF